VISVLIDRKLEQYDKKIRYSLDFLFGTLGYEYRIIQRLTDLADDDLLFFYGLIEPTNEELRSLGPYRVMFVCPVEIEQAGHFNIYEPATQRRSRLAEIIREVQMFRPLPVIAGRPFENPLVISDDSRQVIGRFHFDLIGKVFYHLAGCEELAPAPPPAEQPSAFAEWSHVPVVNMILWMLDQFLQESMKPFRGYLVRRAPWPRGETFAAALTHRVCHLQKWRLGNLFHSMVQDFVWLFTFRWRRLFGSVTGKWRYLLTNWEPYWNFDIIFEQENRHKLRSTFFFGVKADDPEDIDSNPADPDLRPVTNEIERSGREMALLASAFSHKDEKSLRDQKLAFHELWPANRLGIRQNLFRHHRGVTPDLQQKIKACYDSSRGWLQRNGFPDGLAFPWQPFAWDVKDRMHYDVTELPVHFTDRSLRLSNWRNVPPDQAQQIVRNLVQCVQLTQGLLTFEFDVAQFAEIPYLKRLYAFVTDFLVQRGACVDTLHNHWRWWRNRRRVQLFEYPNEILLHFPDEMPAFSLDLVGAMKVLSVEGAKYTLHQGRITLQDIPAGTSVTVRLHAVLARPDTRAEDAANG